MVRKLNVFTDISLIIPSTTICCWMLNCKEQLHLMGLKSLHDLSGANLASAGLVQDMSIKSFSLNSSNFILHRHQKLLGGHLTLLLDTFNFTSESNSYFDGYSNRIHNHFINKLKFDKRDKSSNSNFFLKVLIPYQFC